MEFPAEVGSFLLRRFLKQHLVCVAVSAVEGVHVSGGGGSFRLPRSSCSTNSFYHPTLCLWAVPVLAAKLSNQGETHGLRPLQLESYPIFVACIRVAYECQIWKRDEVVAQQWGMCYIVQFYVHPSVAREEIYVKVTVACDGGFPRFSRPRGRLHSL